MRLADGTVARGFTARQFAILSLAFSADGRYLVSGGGGDRVASGTLDSLVRLWRTSDHAAVATAAQTAWIWSVAFSPDGTLLATGGDGGVFLYRVSDTLEEVATAGAGVRASAVRFSPDGRFLAASLADNVEATPGTVTIWSVER